MLYFVKALPDTGLLHTESTTIEALFVYVGTEPEIWGFVEINSLSQLSYFLRMTSEGETPPHTEMICRPSSIEKLNTIIAYSHCKGQLMYGLATGLLAEQTIVNLTNPILSNKRDYPKVVHWTTMWRINIFLF